MKKNRRKITFMLLCALEAVGLLCACGASDGIQGGKEQGIVQEGEAQETMQGGEGQEIIQPTVVPTIAVETRKYALITYPTLYSDIPDLDIIRTGENYYMVSTTMNLCPGVPIMKSKDLVHWQIVNYVYDILEDDDYGNLEAGKDMYGRGSWAASLRFDEKSGLYYVAFMSNQHGFYIYTTKDIENGDWKKYTSDGWYHDPGLFFEDGAMYVFSASGGTCTLQQLRLNDETGGIETVGASRKLFTATGWSLWEGAHVYKIGAYYYVCIIASPEERWLRTEVCYRSKKLMEGEWEEKVIYQGGSGNNSAGLAQGGLVQTPDGDWYGFLFQDRGGIGRVPSIVAVQWEENWPMMGTYALNGTFHANESSMAMRSTLTDSGEESYFVGDDSFDYAEGERLKLIWQWNHNPVEECWSVTERAGYLRLTTDRVVNTIYEAHNSLTQRTVGPKCETETKLSAAGMKSGDYAGICAMSEHYGMIGVFCNETGEKYIYQANGAFKTAFEELNEKASEPIADTTEVYLKIAYDFGANRANFFYSYDGETWSELGKPLTLGFSTDTTFMGTRSFLFCYATKEAGGYAEFDYYSIRQ